MIKKAFTDITRSCLIILFDVTLLLLTIENLYDIVKQTPEFAMTIALLFLVSMVLFKRSEAFAAFIASVACFVIFIRILHHDYDILLSTGLYSLRIAGMFTVFLFVLRVACLLTYTVNPKLWDMVHDKKEGLSTILPDVKFLSGLCRELGEKE